MTYLSLVLLLICSSFADWSKPIAVANWADQDVSVGFQSPSAPDTSGGAIWFTTRTENKQVPWKWNTSADELEMLDSPWEMMRDAGELPPWSAGSSTPWVFQGNTFVLKNDKTLCLMKWQTDRWIKVKEIGSKNYSWGSTVNLVQTWVFQNQFLVQVRESFGNTYRWFISDGTDLGTTLDVIPKSAPIVTTVLDEGTGPILSRTDGSVWDCRTLPCAELTSQFQFRGAQLWSGVTNLIKWNSYYWFTAPSAQFCRIATQGPSTVDCDLAQDTLRYAHGFYATDTALFFFTRSLDIADYTAPTRVWKLGANKTFTLLAELPNSTYANLHGFSHLNGKLLFLHLLTLYSIDDQPNTLLELANLEVNYPVPGSNVYFMTSYKPWNHYNYFGYNGIPADIRNYAGLPVWNNKVWFSGYDAIHGVELWSSDGRPEGTGIAVDVAPGSEWSDPQSIFVQNDKLNFFGLHGKDGGEPYTYDGVQVKWLGNTSRFEYPDRDDLHCGGRDVFHLRYSLAAQYPYGDNSKWNWTGSGVTVDGILYSVLENGPVIPFTPSYYGPVEWKTDFGFYFLHPDSTLHAWIQRSAGYLDLGKAVQRHNNFIGPSSHFCSGYVPADTAWCIGVDNVKHMLSWDLTSVQQFVDWQGSLWFIGTGPKGNGIYSWDDIDAEPVFHTSIGAATALEGGPSASSLLLRNQTDYWTTDGNHIKVCATGISMPSYASYVSLSPLGKQWIFTGKLSGLVALDCDAGTLTTVPGTERVYFGQKPAETDSVLFFQAADSIHGNELFSYSLQHGFRLEHEVMPGRQGSLMELRGLCVTDTSVYYLGRALENDTLFRIGVPVHPKLSSSEIPSSSSSSDEPSSSSESLSSSLPLSSSSDEPSSSSVPLSSSSTSGGLSSSIGHASSSSAGTGVLRHGSSFVQIHQINGDGITLSHSGQPLRISLFGISGTSWGEFTVLEQGLHLNYPWQTGLPKGMYSVRLTQDGRSVVQRFIRW